VGYLTDELAEQLLPKPAHDNMIFVCGTPPMLKAIAGPKIKGGIQGEVSSFASKLYSISTLLDGINLCLPF
jgi:cytochrome-b5 reductase